MAIKRPTAYTGVTTAEPNSELVMFGLPDPTKWAVYFNDFTKPTDYSTDDFTVTTTEAGAGDATEAISDAKYGILLLTNDAADDDLDSLQIKKETFMPVVGKRMFFKARFKVSDATESDWMIGLAKTDATPLDVSDGMFFIKDDGDAYIDFKVIKNSSTTSVTRIADNVSDTYVVLGFYYNGVDKVEYYVNETYIGEVASTDIPDDDELAVTIHIQNGAAAVKTMSIDYILVANER